jgi:hypothetical protein
MVGDNEKLMLCYLLSFSSVTKLLDKSPYKNVNKITRQISVQNMGPNFCDLLWQSVPHPVLWESSNHIRSQHHSLNFKVSV